MSDTALISGADLVVAYPTAHLPGFALTPGIPVLKKVSVTIASGEIVGIVGESGSGKSTLGRTLLGMVTPRSGVVRFDGYPLASLDQQTSEQRRQLQMIFQDPMSSLNPRHKVTTILTRPLLLHRLASSQLEARSIMDAMLERVGLPRYIGGRYPHELSGGQRQRINIARAAMLKPKFILADEIVSGQDVSTQARILMLLRDLCTEFGMTMAFISHDLAVVRALCSRVYVLHNGQVVEEGPCERVFSAPQHDYTRTLLSAIPLPVAGGGWLNS